MSAASEKSLTEADKQEVDTSTAPLESQPKLDEEAAPPKPQPPSFPDGGREAWIVSGTSPQKDFT